MAQGAFTGKAGTIPAPKLFPVAVDPLVPYSRRTIESLSSLALTLILASATTLCIHAGLIEPDRLHALTFSASLCLFAVILMPPSSTRTDLMACSIGVGLICLLAALTARHVEPGDATVLALTATVLVLGLGSIQQAISRHADEYAAPLMAAIAINLWAVPLWLAPVAEHFYSQPWFTDLVVNLSPVTHLAAALEVDYLRGNWFYRYSILGSLRFEYAPPMVTIVMWTLVALTAQLLLHLTHLRTQGTTGS